MTDRNEAFCLADWYVDTASNRLIRGGREVKLESKVMEVLAYLARQPYEVVSREALENAVWGKTVVGYDALTGAIAKLRRVLGDNPRQPRFIETIAKKGYRLICEVVPPAQLQVPAPAVRSPVLLRHNRVLAAGLGMLVLGLMLVLSYDSPRRTLHPAAAMTQQPAIVVLPFTNLSDAPESDYFSDGMTTDITTELSRLSGLFVIAHSSARDWRDGPTDIRRVAESLGAQYVLDGTVRRANDRLRVNVHLIDIQREVYLWSEKYDRQVQGLFDVQDDITANIVKALSVRLTEEETSRVARRYTNSLAAYDDFLRGLAHYNRYTPEDNRLAREYYQQALMRDTLFARAYSAMALTYVAEHRYAWGNSAEDGLAEALRLARHAVTLENTVPQAYWALAYVHVFRQDFPAATQAARQAIRLDPNYADSYVTLAVCKLHFGEPEEARDLMKRAMLLNPRYPAAYASVLGQIHYTLGEYESATIRFREAIERNINLITPHVFLIASLSSLDRSEELAWAAGQLKAVAEDFDSTSLHGMLPIQDEKLLAEVRGHLRRAGL